jgi:hypothetical protein
MLDPLGGRKGALYGTAAGATSHAVHSELGNYSVGLKRNIFDNPGRKPGITKDRT